MFTLDSINLIIIQLFICGFKKKNIFISIAIRKHNYIKSK